MHVCLSLSACGGMGWGGGVCVFVGGEGVDGTAST